MWGPNPTLPLFKDVKEKASRSLLWSSLEFSKLQVHLAMKYMCRRPLHFGSEEDPAYLDIRDSAIWQASKLAKVRFWFLLAGYTSMMHRSQYTDNMQRSFLLPFLIYLWIESTCSLYLFINKGQEKLWCLFYPSDKSLSHLSQISTPVVLEGATITRAIQAPVLGSLNTVRLDSYFCISLSRGTTQVSLLSCKRYFKSRDLTMPYLQNTSAEKQVLRQLKVMGLDPQPANVKYGIATFISAPDLNLVIEMESEHHFFKNKPDMPHGRTVFRRGLLRSMNLQLLCIHVDEWYALPNETAQYKFLSQKLGQSLGKNFQHGW